MGYEVDFLDVGEGERCGDAIAIRYGELTSASPTQKIVVIDGGFKASGEALVSHVRNFYHSDRVDLAVLTHPDQDHASGLEIVLNELAVARLWMHRPWSHTHTAGIAEMFKSGRVTDTSVREALRRSLDDARALEQLALSKGIPIDEPFCGTEFDGGALRVVGPTTEFYESLLPGFRGTPTPKEESGLIGRAVRAVSEAVSKLFESMDVETLSDDVQTSAENNTSTVILARLDGSQLLFTGDAGIPALNAAADELASLGVGPNQLSFIQIPHHGSIHSVGPAVLDRLLGPKQRADQTRMTAFVSASREGPPRHPAKKVTNAFRRRGAAVHSTQGAKKVHFHESPSRGWFQSTPVPFYDQVEEID
jgi:beta-lactamase superfamily II metal-dependent hydrolase